MNSIERSILALQACIEELHGVKELPILNLGQLIDLLKKVRQDAWVYIDGPVRLTPGEVRSYRGYYCDLAIGVNLDGLAPSVCNFIQTLEQAIGTSFEGYKGGIYLMDRQTRLWFSNYGESYRYGPTGIRTEPDSAHVIVTYAEVE